MSSDRCQMKNKKSLILQVKKEARVNEDTEFVLQYLQSYRAFIKS